MSQDEPAGAQPRRDKPAEEVQPTYPRTSLAGWVSRRREKAVAEIERNRRGEYKVPTWVLVVALVAVVGAWLAVIIFAGR
jgi:hypothetical protein